MGNTFSLSVFDIAVIVVSIMLVLIVGWIASRRQEKTAKGYFLASGRLPWYVIGSAFVSTSVSSEQIVGTVGQAYRSGMGVANWEWWTLPVYGLMIIFFIPMFMRSKISTIPEFLKGRFGPLCADIYSWVMLLAYVLVFLVTVLYGGSLAFSELTGWNFSVVLWATVILVGLYSIKGGLSSVVWTDAVQCAMLVGGGLVLFFIALNKIPGGWSAMVQANPTNFHLYHPANDPVAPFLGILLGSVGVFIFYSAGNQVMIQRVLGARSKWDGMMGIVFAGLINMLRPLVTCFLGLIVWHWINIMKEAPPLDNADKVFSFALRIFTPEWGLRGIILAGFLAAVMSTISALANSAATIFSLDVYRRLINPKANDRKLVFMGRMASLTCLVVAGLLAPAVEHFGGIFLYFQQCVTYLAVPFITVIFFGLLWKRTNFEGAFFGLLGGIMIMVSVVLVDLFIKKQGYYAAWGLPNGLHWIYLGFIAQVLIALGIVAVSLAYPAPAKAQWEPFQWTPRHLAQFDDGIRRPWYQKVWFWFAIYTVIWLSTYYWFW